MASSGNFSTFNPLNCATTSGYGNHTFANANTQATASSTGNSNVTATIATGNTGKYYAEFYLVATDGTAYLGYCSVLQTPTMTASGQAWVPNANVTWNPGNLASYFQNGELRKDGSTTSSWGSTFTTGDIIQIAIDADNDAVYYGKNNTWQNSGDPESGASKTGAARTSIPKNVLPAVGHANGGSSTVTWKANFGQDSTFSGTVSAGGNTDANGFGDFKYAPPSGYVALSTANLPISDDIDPAQTDDDYPSKQFGAVLYTGNGSSHAITGLGFQPDLVWGKMRSSSQAGILIDSSRGQGLLFSSTTSVEQTSNGPFMTSYDSDGFTLASSGSNPNDSGKTYVAWCWRANGGTTASNSDGDITSTVQANTKAGFSIVTYTGNRTSAGVSTVGHGLDSAPDMVITKSRSNLGNWWVQHTGTSSASKMFNLQSDSAEIDKSSNGTLSRPTATVFGTNYTDGLGTNGQTHIAYCWHSVEGYSKFGTYEGNSNADGPFVYTGFRPRMLFTKNVDGVGGWRVRDTVRSENNPTQRILWWDLAQQEYSNSAYSIDILSNGFKLRTSSGDFNASNTWVYGAWGDVPFKYNNTF